MRLRRTAGLIAVPLVLAACNNDAPEPEAQQTEIPEELQTDEADAPAIAVDGIGTPMGERVATLGLINKRNNLSRDIEIRPGESQRFDDVIVRLYACERTAPWEEIQQTGGFVQVFVNERPEGQDDRLWNRVFSGWLFKESPSLNVVEHPIYDVWLKDCAMSFPGEEEAVADS
ncbi:DUF2155 domain-containing protein [Aurantiacibacter aquimixticola]|uniref:DUF2155 domain-containing protein n=1 Tax=Aurantiacibacter aquimixticola TaxID=1958945 RepID=UPI001F5B82D5|nr:DUF2155 domain-containing protein [Aurantiacibacter aquimixticola]